MNNSDQLRTWQVEEAHEISQLYLESPIKSGYLDSEAIEATVII